MITELVTTSGRSYRVHEKGYFISISDCDTVFVVKTADRAIIRIFAKAVESITLEDK